MDITDITDEVITEPEMRMYEYAGWLIVIKARVSERTNYLTKGGKFKYRNNVGARVVKADVWSATLTTQPASFQCDC